LLHQREDVEAGDRFDAHAGNRGMSSKQAMTEYIQLVDALAASDSNHDKK